MNEQVLTDLSTLVAELVGEINAAALIQASLAAALVEGNPQLANKIEIALNAHTEVLEPARSQVGMVGARQKTFEGRIALFRQLLAAAKN